MPLKVMDVVELRLRMVNEVRDRRISPREVAERYGGSKTQLYEWLRRYEQHGVEGLVPRSRRPGHSPRQLDAATEDEIVRWRKKRPRWGAKKIRAILQREGWVPVPAVSTVQQVLLRRGFVVAVRRSRVPAEGWQSFVRPYPNDLWHVDATQHRLANGRPFWVIDLLDDHSRFLLTTYVCVSPTCESGWTAMRQAVAAYGLPRQLLSDNGLNFTGRLHQLTVAFERQVRAAGIEFIHSRPQHPETLGKHERQHRTQNEWIADHGAPRSLRAAQTLLDAYRADYNNARPHEAIGQHFPVELYQPGPPIELPAVELAPADPYPEGCLKRRVDTSGRVDYSRTAFPLDRRWTGITVGLIRRGAYLEVYYGAALIDTFIVGDLPEPTARGRRPNN
jgi:transposase InsO family protein